MNCRTGYLAPTDRPRELGMVPVRQGPWNHRAALEAVGPPAVVTSFITTHLRFTAGPRGRPVPLLVNQLVGGPEAAISRPQGFTLTRS